MKLPTVTLHGTPFEQGRQHGAQFRREIAVAITELKSAHEESGYRRAAALARDAWPEVQVQAKAVSAELEGIAAGANSKSSR